MRMLSMSKGMRTQRGVSLVEVMIAMLVTTAGLLGFAGLQTRALTATEDAYLRVQAMSIAQDLIERARINDVVGPTQSYAPGNTGYTDTTEWEKTLTAARPSEMKDCYIMTSSMIGSSGCPVATRIAMDIYQLRRRASQMLPDGEVWAQACNGGRMCVFVSWGGEKAEDCAYDYTDASSPSVPRECMVIEGV